VASNTRVLLLHGQPGGTRDWDRVIAALPSGLDPLAIARPGWNGASRPVDLRGNALAAADALDAPAIVVGHSFGAGVAAWLAVLAPELIRALVLVSPSANTAALEPFDGVLAAPVLGPALSGVMLGAVGGALSLPPVRHLIASRLGLDQGFLRAGGRLLLRPQSWRSFEVEQRALFRDLPALEERLGEIAAPTTIVSGTADRVVPSRAPRLLATQIPGARLQLVEGAGHMLPHRQPGVVARAISELV
jgi:pimeloyl-ACP methyl ester carboxylesterase